MNWKSLLNTAAHGQSSSKGAYSFLNNQMLYRYFNQDENAGRSMTQTLATLPSSHRAPFSRVQASIRAAYHRSVNARKTAEFRAHLAATQPGGSLLPHNRVKPSGPEAKKGR